MEKESSQIAEVDAPLSFLKGELPIRPWLMGNLIPQSTNLWLGSSTNGTLQRDLLAFIFFHWCQVILPNDRSES